MEGAGYRKWWGNLGGNRKILYLDFMKKEGAGNQGHLVPETILMLS